jgi:hypothetical protein
LKTACVTFADGANPDNQNFMLCHTVCLSLRSRCAHLHD